MAHGMDSLLINAMGKDLAEAQKKLSEIVSGIEGVCFYSATLPAKDVSGYEETDYYQVALKEKIEFSRAIGATAAAYATIRSVSAYALRMFIEDRRERFQLAVHLKYYADRGGKAAAYMISKEALEALPIEAVLRDLLPKVGSELLCYLRKERG